MSDGMTRAQRREARLALAMLPVGAAVLVVSALAFVAVVALALATPWVGGADWRWTEMWCLLAGTVALRNARAGIGVMSAFDWRPVPAVLALSGAVVAAWPGWWLQ